MWLMDSNLRTMEEGQAPEQRRTGREGFQVVMAVEAMKMRHAMTAPHAGTVHSLHVRTDNQVKVDQLLAIVSTA